MTAYERLQFDVGERTPDDARRLKLEGVLLEPSTPAQGTIVFSPGFTEIIQRTLHVLTPLSRDFRIIAYDNRGHGHSEGVLEPEAAVRDLDAVLATAGGQPVLLGHSFGCSVTARASASSRGCYWIAPYLDPGMLGPFQRAGIAVLNHGGPVIGLVDGLIDRSGALASMGVYLARPLASMARLADVRPAPVSVLLAYIVPGRDEVIPPARSRALVKERYPGAEDHSELARTLNHCLNCNYRDFRPLCKPENGKDTNAIIESIARFSSERFKKAQAGPSVSP